jgi:hypothetical protein
LGRNADPVQSREARLKRLASQIDALAEKDAMMVRHSRDMAALRRGAAAELHKICLHFVESINGLLDKSEIEMDPPSYPEGAFSDSVSNLFQINVRGRILQVEFEATQELVSTEDFRIPYTLAGAVRAFNQELLEKDLIEEQLIFFTLERHGRMWRFFDARTYRSGAFDQDYLISLMEQLM